MKYKLSLEKLQRGHRIHLGKRRSQFESRRDISKNENNNNIVVNCSLAASVGQI
jgi:hypothetical protein